MFVHRYLYMSFTWHTLTAYVRCVVISAFYTYGAVFAVMIVASTDPYINVTFGDL